ncbi:MAG: hypothetical protein K0R68_3257, partial [Mycobacterium sp.]|nr:hypothetical protein [Mycobacterium sp.]
MDELEILSRAHQLFATAGVAATVASDVDHLDAALRRAADQNTGGGHERYRTAVDSARDFLHRAASTDREFAALVARAQRDHATARDLTRAVLEAARSDFGAPTDSPVAQREAMRRTAQRLRAQQQYVLTARRRARRRLAVLLLLRYRGRRRAGGLGGMALPPPGSRAGVAVRAALSRLG